MAYKNGRLPDTALKRTLLGIRLAKSAANSANRLYRLYEIIYGEKLAATDGYRALGPGPYTQITTFLGRYRPQASGSGPYGDVRYYKGVRYVRVSGAAAAVPGTSNHGWGRAIDFNMRGGGFGGTVHRRLSAIAGDLGWDNVEGRSVGEPWHWVYKVGNDKQRSRVGWYHVTSRTAGATGARAYKTRATGKRGNISRTICVGRNVKILLIIGGWGLTRKLDWIKISKLTKGRKA